MWSLFIEDVLMQALWQSPGSQAAGVQLGAFPGQPGAGRSMPDGRRPTATSPVVLDKASTPV